MARIRRPADSAGGAKEKAPVWAVAAYIRLSREDGGDESLSVVNQRKIIQDYLEHAFIGEYVFAGFYTDDGLSGTDYDRPAFQRMLQDVEAGAVTCVVCKNLSRAFRNYADQGYFLESYFPLHGTRFISIGDPKVDSYLRPESIQNLEVPIAGLMNDRYAARTSSDVRATFDAKRKNGEFIGAFAPYGYAKNPEDKNRLIIDEAAAQPVRDIYRWFAHEGLSKNAIAQRLNALGVPNPTEYKRRKGLRYTNPGGNVNDGLWSAGTIARILKNPVYAGSMVQGRQRVISYKVHRRVAAPETEWFVKTGTHEAVVDADTFALAQKLQLRDTRTPPARNVLHLFSGFLRCADCQKALTRKTSKGYVYYCCRTYGEKSKAKCTRHSIREDVLYQAVLKALQAQVALVAQDAVVAAIQTAPAAPPASRRRALAQRERERAHEKVIALMDGLYVDWKSGDITGAEYHRLKAGFARQAEQLEQALQAQDQTAKQNEKPVAPALEYFLEHRGIDRLERGLLLALVDSIYVYEGGALRIQFTFPNPSS